MTESISTKQIERRSWPYFRTPLPVFLFVMLPVNGLMLFLLFSRSDAWQKWSAGLLHALSIFALYRGYFVRLMITPTGVRLRRLFASIDIAWADINDIGEYIPGGGLGATEYIYITKHDHQPAGKWDIDENTIQIQSRDGLLECIKNVKGKAGDADATQHTDKKSTFATVPISLQANSRDLEYDVRILSLSHASSQLRATGKLLHGLMVFHNQMRPLRYGTG